MILFSSSGGSGATSILKILAVIGAAFLGLLKTCGRSADDVARIGRRADNIADFRQADDIGALRYSDEAGNVRYTDDVMNSTTGGLLRIDDAFTMSDEIANSRLLVFEVKYTNVLDNSSFVRQSFEKWKGYSPAMRLKMMQIELMPPAVKSAMMRPGGEELYAVMTGKRLSAEEASSLRDLFGLSVKETKESASRYIYLREEINALGNDPDQLYRDYLRRKDRGIDAIIQETEYSTINGVKKLDEAAEAGGKKVFEKKTVLAESKLNWKDAFKLIKLGRKVMHLVEYYASNEKQAAEDVVFLMYVPESDSVLRAHYQLDEEEVKKMRRDIHSLVSKKKIVPLKEANDFTSFYFQEDKRYFFIYNQQKWYSVNIRKGSPVYPLDIDGYEFSPDNNFENPLHGLQFSLLSESLKLSTKNNLSMNDYLERLAVQYLAQLEKKSGLTDRYVIYIHPQFIRNGNQNMSPFGIEMIGDEQTQ